MLNQTETEARDALSLNTDGVQPNGSAEEFPDLEDEDEAAHRLRAIAHHRSRFFGQARTALLVVIFASVAPGFWRIVFTILGGENATPRILSGAEKWIVDGLISANALIQVSLIYLFALAPIIFLSSYIGLTLWYRRERNHEWDVAKALADAREPEDSAHGFMQVFRLYARTKRRAIFAMLFGITGFWWMISCFWTLAEGGSATLDMQGVAFGLPLIAAIIGLLSMYCIYLAYDISRNFVPGKVLVRKTLIMSMLATTSQTDYTAARIAAHELEKDLIDDRPWWFYSYRKKPEQHRR